MWQEFITYLTRDDLAAPDKIFRSVITYVALLVGLRLAGKRELGQMSAFDLVLFLMLASALETTIQGGDVSVVGGVLAFAVLLVINKALAWLNFHLPHARPVLEGKATELVRDGRWVEENIREELINKDEILAEAKQAGIDRLEDIGSFVIEVDGTPSVERRGDSPELRAIKELGTRLDALERHLGAGVPPPAGSDTGRAGDRPRGSGTSGTKPPPPQTRAHEPTWRRGE